MSHIDFFLWAPSREAYAAVIPNILFPNGQALGRVPLEGERTQDGNALLYPAGITASEIGEIVKVPATYDENGTELTPAEVVEGYHVNIRATGWVYDLLVAGRPDEGTLWERTNILALIEGLGWEVAEGGVPAGYVGPNGVRLIDPATVGTPARQWG